MTKHLIRHYGKYIYRHEDYQAICQGDDCASQILSLFEFWTICRIEEIKRVESYNEQNKRSKAHLLQTPDLWLYETMEDISGGMINAYGDSSIRKSLKKLIAWGFIDSRKSKNDFDRTKEYKFNTESIQSSLDQWWNAQSIGNSDPVKTTFEPLEKTLETVKTTFEPLKKTHEPLNLTSDLYSLNSLNKQSLLTEDEGSEIELNPNTEDPNPELIAPLVNKPESSQPTDNSALGAIIPPPRPASSHNKADELFTNPREFNSAKGTYKSASSDPWMSSAHNPDKGFSEWLFSKRYKDKPSATLADAKAEIRNSWERASDLWEEYQFELLKKQQRVEIIDPVPDEPYKPQQKPGRMTEEARNEFIQKLASK